MHRDICISLLLFLLTLQVQAETADWQVTKSTHFIIYKKNAPEDFIKELIAQAEDYYNKIADDLGFRRYDFWLWDNRAKIYIYDNQSDYQSATGQPKWSGGCARVETKTIQTFPYAQGFLETILPHELGHIILREFVGFENNTVPLWFEEGVASFQEKLRSVTAKRIIQEAIKEGKFMNLEKLSRVNPQLLQDIKLVDLFYAESKAIVEYLIKEFGKDNFVTLCRDLKEGKSFERAIASSFPFSNLQELDSAWQKYIQK